MNITKTDNKDLMTLEKAEQYLNRRKEVKDLYNMLIEMDNSGLLDVIQKKGWRGTITKLIKNTEKYAKKEFGVYLDWN